MPHPGSGFPIPPLQWPRIGQQWPAYNVESDQADGLVAWYPTLASRGAPPLRDYSSLQHNLSATNFNKYIYDPVVGPALRFNNSMQLTGSGPGFSGSHTVSMWVNVHSYDNARAEAFIYTTNQSFVLRISGTAGVLHYLTRTAGGFVTNIINAWPTDAWMLLVGTYDGTNQTFYLDGEQGDQDPQSGTLYSSVDDIQVGHYNTNLLLTDTDVADVRIYDVAKTGAAVSQMAAEPWELHQIPRRLWRLGVPTGITIGMDTLSLAGTAQTLTQVSGAVSLAMDVLGITGSAQALDISVGAVSLTMDALGLLGSAQGLTISPGTVSLAMDVLSLAGTAQSLNVAPGSVSLAMDALDLSGTAETLTQVSGAVNLAMDALNLSGTAQSLTVSTGIRIALALLALTGSAQGLAVVPGEATVALSELQITAAALAVAIVLAGKLDATLTDAAVTLLALSDAVVTALAVDDTVIASLTLDNVTRD